MQNNRNLKDLFPLPLRDTSFYDLSQGEVYIDLRRDIFIWGIVFQKATFKEATKLQIQISYKRDTENGNMGYTTSLSKHSINWINPDGSDPNTPLELVFDPADMDDGGCIFFKQPSDPTKIMSFVASHIKIKGIYGLISTIVFDFVGTTITYDGGQGILGKLNHHLTSTKFDDRFLDHFYYTGNGFIVILILIFFCLQRTPLSS